MPGQEETRVAEPTDVSIRNQVEQYLSEERERARKNSWRAIWALIGANAVVIIAAYTSLHQVLTTAAESQAKTILSNRLSAQEETIKQLISGIVDLAQQAAGQLGAIKLRVEEAKKKNEDLGQLVTQVEKDIVVHSDQVKKEIQLSLDTRRRELEEQAGEIQRVDELIRNLLERASDIDNDSVIDHAQRAWP